MRYILKGMAAVMMAGAALTAQAEEPVITFRTNIYDQYGAQNRFHIVLGATETDYFDVDCGFGSVEVEVAQATFDTEAQTMKGTPIPCQVDENGIVKIYGDASKIDYIDAEGCYIEWIDIDQCTNLSILDLQHNELKRLDLTPFTKLQALYLSDNTFTAETPLKVGGNKPELQILELDIIDHIDQSFNLSDYPALVIFDGYHNMDLRKVDPTGCPELLALSVELTPVETLDVTKNPKLMRLNISDSRITSVDISQNPLLQHFLAQHVSGSVNTDVKLTGVDVTNNPNLVILNLGGNEIESIDLSKNTYLTDLVLNRNNLSAIDLSANTNLYSVDLSYNNFTFATLPLPENTWGEYYYYRDPLPCDKSYAVGSQIDFSKDVLRQGTTTTVRVWQDPVDSQPLLVDPEFYTFADGKISINTVMQDSVYVEFINSAFPEYNLLSGTFMVKEADQMGKPSKALSMKLAPAMAGASLAFRVGLDNASAQTPGTFYVDLGDGELHPYTTTTSTMPEEDNFVALLSEEPGTVTVYLPEGESLTAFGVENVTLSSIDLTAATEVRWLKVKGCNLTSLNMANNRCLQTLDISGNRLGNVTLAGAYGDYEKNALQEINASNNRIYNFTVVSTAQLRKLDLSGNLLTSFVLKNYDGLTDLNLSNNRLKEEVNLSYLANARNIDLSRNNITTLVTTDMPALESFDVTNNNLTIETMPLLKGVGDDVFRYAPQKDIAITSLAPGINLSAQYRVVGDAATVFTWKKADGTPLVEGVDMTCVNGATRFLDPQLGKVYCEMTNAAFPQFTGSAVLKTTEVTVTDAPTTVVATFTTTADSESAEVIFTGTKTSALYIDWRGDGTEFIQYPINGDTYTVYSGQKTYAGAKATVYTYESVDDVRQFAIYGAAMSSMDASKMKNLKAFSLGGAGLDEQTLVMPQSENLEEITLTDNKFSTKDFKEFKKLRHLILSGNGYETYDASGMSALETLMLSANGLKSLTLGGNTSLWGLDLSSNELTDVSFEGAPALSQILISSNKLTSIDLTPVQNVLVALDIQNNGFDFSSLPRQSQYPRLGAYMFVNQAPLEVECIDGSVDLSAQAEVEGTPTFYRWFLGDVTLDPETGELTGEELETGVDDPEYVVEGGVTTFRYTFDKPVICVMTNEKYSGLMLYTKPLIVDKAGIESVGADADDAPVDVYSITGVKVRSQVARKDALQGLAPGIYICGGRKLLVK